MLRRTARLRRSRRGAPPAGPERLDPRLALAVTTFTDVDGDLVTVSTSKGTKAGLEAARTTTASGIGLQLRKIDFQDAQFAGTDLTVTAKRVGHGDGFVNVGEIFAEGRDLGNVLVRGDLGIVETVGRIGTLTVGGSVFGGSGDDSGGVRADRGFGTATVAGRLDGNSFIETFGIVARSIGPVKAAGTTLAMPAAGDAQRVGTTGVFLHVLP